MSVKFDAPSATRSKEMFLADPYEIDLDSSLRGRHDIPSDEKIREMADSIRRVGQLEAITTRKLPSGKVQVIYGYTRLLACRLLKDEDPEFKIRFTVETNVNDQDAFTRAVTENLVRNETTLIDTAYNLQRFMDVYGWNAARCAEFYRFGNQSKVTQIRSLTGLPVEAQQQVSAGMISLATALDMLTLPEGDVKAIVQEAKKAAEMAAPLDIEVGQEASPMAPGETIVLATGETVWRYIEPATEPKKGRGRPKGSVAKGPKAEKAKKAAVKKAVSEKVKAATKAAGKQTPRTISELKSVLLGRADAISETLRAYLSGDQRIGDKELAKQLDHHDLEARARRGEKIKAMPGVGSSVVTKSGESVVLTFDGK